MKKKPKIVVEEGVRPDPEYARREEAKAKVAHAVMAGHSQASAAEIAGVHETSISRWKKADPNFAAIIDDPVKASNDANEVWKNEGRTSIQLRKAADVAVLRYKLQGVAASAIDILADLLHSEDDRVRLGAVREILDRTGLVRSSEVTVTGSIASQIQPAMLAEAFQVLGISPEEVRKSLPVDGEVIHENEHAHDERSNRSDRATAEVPAQDARRDGGEVPGCDGMGDSDPGMRVPGELDSSADRPTKPDCPSAKAEGAGL